MGCAVLCQLGQALPVPISMPSEFLKGHAKNKRNLKICRLCSGGFFAEMSKKNQNKAVFVGLRGNRQQRERAEMVFLPLRYFGVAAATAKTWEDETEWRCQQRR